MTTLSVLLIVGAAVIGPIEAQQTVSLVGSVNLIKTETLPELCERAMREIGIDTENKGGFLGYAELWKVAQDGSREFVRAVGAYLPVNVVGDDWPVRCIPTPAGYRR